VLPGGIANRGEVVRIGDTVHRPQRATAQATHALLQHLEAVGFDGAPRFLGVDARNREILSHISGTPGERGPAVIAGHVDSKRGPAVFFRLPDLGRGDRIFVDRADGTTAVFAAQRIERHDKATFPTDAVYGDTPDPQLRLITCGGKFDRKHRRYLDNVIVFAIRSG
jgi:hypothetical protein